VVCVSDWTRKALLTRYPELPPSRVSMVHSGVDHVRPAAFDAVAEAWFRSLGLPERWVLFAGALDARKNVGLLLSALEHLGAAAPALVLAGQPWFGLRCWSGGWAGCAHGASTSGRWGTSPRRCSGC
jgi:hypothetical protein